MTLATLFVTAEHAVIEEIKQLLGVVETTLASTIQHAVAAVKATDLGTRVANLIELASNESLSGAEKFEKVVAAVVDDAGAFLANGGFSHLVVQAEDFAREWVQSAYNDWKTAFG